MLQVSREEWIEAGWKEFLAKGPRAVAVEPVARALGVTKGSFYSKFKDRAELLEEVMNHFLGIANQHFSNAQIGPEHLDEVIKAMVKLSAGEGGFGQIMGSLFSTEPEMSQTLNQILKARIDYLASSLESRGFPPEQARARAYLIASTYAGLTMISALAPERLEEAANAENEMARVLASASKPD